MKKEKILKIIDYISLGASIIISITYAILDTIGIQVLSLIGWLFGCLATHFISNGILEDALAKNNSEFERKLNELICKFDNPMTYTLNQLNTTKLVVDSIEDIDAYLAERIPQAKVSVYDFCWWDFSQAPKQVHRNEITAKKNSINIDDAIAKFCKGKNKIYKEIFSFHSTANKRKLLTHICFGENYQCAYFDTSSYKFPKMQFVIIDDKEVVFASRFYQKHCIIKDKDIVGLMLNYFDQAWVLAHKIKDEDAFDENLVNKVKQDLNNIK